MFLNKKFIRAIFSCQTAKWATVEPSLSITLNFNNDGDKDLFVATLNNPQQTDVNSRIHNKTTVYDLALENINNATTQTELDAVTWNFLNPTGIIIDVNAEANKMLADATVSAIAKLAINAAKDPVTNEIHLVKTLPELAANS